jgi:hypothetical protein
MRFIIALLLCLTAMPAGVARAQSPDTSVDLDDSVRGMIPRLLRVDLNDREAIGAVLGRPLKPYGTPRIYLRQWWTFDQNSSDPYAFYAVYTTAGPETRQTPNIEARIGETEISVDEMRAAYPGMKRLPAPLVADGKDDTLYEIPGGPNIVLLVFGADTDRLTHIFVEARPRVRVPNLFAGIDMGKVAEVRIQWPQISPNVRTLRAPGTDSERLARGQARSGRRCPLDAADAATLTGILGRARPVDREVISLSLEVSFIFRLKDGSELLAMLTYPNAREGGMLILPGGVLNLMSAADAVILDKLVADCV